MEERVLRLTVFDVDRHKKHVVIGHALYTLKAHAHNNERRVTWRDLEREVSEVGTASTGCAARVAVTAGTVLGWNRKQITSGRDKHASLKIVKMRARLG